ncbi:RhoGAP domain [Pelomyxa schiedti]|nr:RhoGAP domain [Pelomyxa schiedti]KAH3745430.1 RhoGAP domain [Pelomyxa schiedti]
MQATELSFVRRTSQKRVPHNKTNVTAAAGATPSTPASPLSPAIQAAAARRPKTTAARPPFVVFPIPIPIPCLFFHHRGGAAGSPAAAHAPRAGPRARGRGLDSPLAAQRCGLAYPAAAAGAGAAPPHHHQAPRLPDLLTTATATGTAATTAATTTTTPTKHHYRNDDRVTRIPGRRTSTANSHPPSPSSSPLTLSSSGGSGGVETEEKQGSTVHHEGDKEPSSVVDDDIMLIAPLAPDDEAPSVPDAPDEEAPSPSLPDDEAPSLPPQSMILSPSGSLQAVNLCDGDTEEGMDGDDLPAPAPPVLASLHPNVTPGENLITGKTAVNTSISCREIPNSISPVAVGGQERVNGSPTLLSNSNSELNSRTPPTKQPPNHTEDSFPSIPDQVIDLPPPLTLAPVPAVQAPVPSTPPAQLPPPVIPAHTPTSQAAVQPPLITPVAPSPTPQQPAATVAAPAEQQTVRPCIPTPILPSIPMPVLPCIPTPILPKLPSSVPVVLPVIPAPSPTVLLPTPAPKSPPMVATSPTAAPPSFMTLSKPPPLLPTTLPPSTLVSPTIPTVSLPHPHPNLPPPPPPSSGCSPTLHPSAPSKGLPPPFLHPLVARFGAHLEPEAPPKSTPPTTEPTQKPPKRTLFQLSSDDTCDPRIVASQRIIRQWIFRRWMVLASSYLIPLERDAGKMWPELLPQHIVTLLSSVMMIQELHAQIVDGLNKGVGAIFCDSEIRGKFKVYSVYLDSLHIADSIQKLQDNSLPFAVWHNQQFLTCGSLFDELVHLPESSLHNIPTFLKGLCSGPAEPAMPMGAETESLDLVQLNESVQFFQQFCKVFSESQHQRLVKKYFTDTVTKLGGFSSQFPEDIGRILLYEIEVQQVKKRKSTVTLKAVVFSDQIILVTAKKIKPKVEIYEKTTVIKMTDVVDVVDVEGADPMLQFNIKSANKIKKITLKMGLRDKNRAFSALKDLLERRKNHIVFGSKLSDLIHNEYREQIGIPLLVEKGFSFLEKCTINTTITQIATSTNPVLALKIQVDISLTPTVTENYEYQFKPDQDAFSVSSLLKVYFREMAEPIFPFDLYVPMTDLHDTEKEEFITRVTPMLRALPEYNRITLKYTMDFFQKLIGHRQTNKMDAKNLSIVIAPNFLRPAVETLDTTTQLPKVNSVFAKLIDSYPELSQLF